MLIVPKQKIIRSVDDIPELKEVKRNILVYTDNPLNIGKQQFALINNSIQMGSIGAIQSKSEILYTINCYYGTVDDPTFINPVTKQIEINQDAQVRIENNGYIYKLIDTSGLVPDVHTVNWFMGEFHGDYAFYKNSKDINYNTLMPSDPRFYNQDQQLKMVDTFHPFFALGYDDAPMDDTARYGGGLKYRLGDLIDDHTTFKSIFLKVDDPYKVLDFDKDLKIFVNSMLVNIVNSGMLILAKEFKVIIDKMMGYNALDIHRSFNYMEKKYEQVDVKNFYHNIKTEFEKLRDSKWNVRVTIVYDEFKTYLQVLPNDTSLFKPRETKFTRNLIESYMEENYN